MTSATEASKLTGASEPRPLPAIAAATLPRVVELAEVFVSQVSSIHGYSEGLIDHLELQKSAERSLDLLMRRIAHLVSDAEMINWSSSIGRSRVDAGVPLDSLMQAVRLDFRLVWGALSDEIRPNEMPALVDGGADVWEAVEKHASATLRGYQAREAEITRAREGEQKSWLARLVDSGGEHAETARRAAQVLGFGVDRSFLIVTAVPGRLASTRDALTDRGIVSHVYPTDDGDALVVQLPVGAEREWQTWFDNQDCVVGIPTPGLTTVPRQTVLGLACLAAIGQPVGPVPIARTWFRLAVHTLGDYQRDVARDVLAPLQALSTSEADRLTETVRIYLESGNVTEAAQQLFCHRNTVFNRLQRFRATVGLDPSNPKDSSLIRLALLSHRG